MDAYGYSHRCAGELLFTRTEEVALLSYEHSINHTAMNTHSPENFSLDINHIIYNIYNCVHRFLCVCSSLSKHPFNASVCHVNANNNYRWFRLHSDVSKNMFKNILIIRPFRLPRILHTFTRSIVEYNCSMLLLLLLFVVASENWFETHWILYGIDA